MSRKYKFWDQESIYFVSFATVMWVDVFTRKTYRDIFIDSLAYCQKEKGLILYAYVIMSNHVHLLISKKENFVTLSDIMRDLKKYTAFRLLKAIHEHPEESRREWMQGIFSKSVKENGNTCYQFWQQNNHPLLLSDDDKIENVLNYIHDNPVKAGWVSEAEDYWYSSARNYAERESHLKITSIFDGIEI